MKHTPEELRRWADDYRRRTQAEDDLRGERIPPFDRCSTVEAIERYEHLRIADVFEAYANLLDRERWVPVSERLPKEGLVVLGWSLKEGFVDIACQFNGQWLGENSHPFQVTHWKELPQPPEEP